MKVMLDTNVVLDHLLDRKPFAQFSAAIFSEIEKGAIRGVIGATTVTTIHYLVSKALGQTSAINTVKLLLRLFEAAPINHLVLSGALEIASKDFEDAVLIEAGLHVGVTAIITRDRHGFSHSPISVFSPNEFLRTLKG
ncbi:MAG: PIN domain-containing protein [Myxococcaceae bacterium]